MTEIGLHKLNLVITPLFSKMYPILFLELSSHGH